MIEYGMESALAALSQASASRDDLDAREAHLLAEERRRIHWIGRRRTYYAGDQYDAENQSTAEANEVIDSHELPEHLKKHAYSTQIQESVDFLAAQLSETFKIDCKDATVQATLEKVLTSSPDLSSGDADEDDLSVTNVLRDALLAGDTPVYVRWDAVEETAWFEFWESESVDFRYKENDRHVLEKVIVTEFKWSDLDGEVVQKIQRTTYEMIGGECARTITLDGIEQGGPEYLGLPFIPWRLLRASKKKIRGTRGESVITRQAMAAADRYDALENTGFLIARYNSHGNLAVVGDGASLKIESEGRVSKDVADVLTFPGGTSVSVITLPTDPKMIEHQRQVLLDSLYGTFGLTRIDQSTVQGMGNVSGYALEILNRKSDGTFSQVGKQWQRDMRALLNVALDVTAYKQSEEADMRTQGLLANPDVADGTVSALDSEVDMESLSVAVLVRMQGIDPDALFPNRTIGIQMGTGYIVDEVMIRDDFTAGLISIEEALRQRGKGPDEIRDILKEIDKRKPAAPEVGLSTTAQAAAQAALDASKAQAAGATGAALVPSAKAGSTLGSATSDQGSTP